MYRAGAESEARQGAILEAAADAILTIDGALHIREFNPAAEKMFGYGRLDILGKKAELLFAMQKREELLRALKRYLDSGEGRLASERQLELVAVRADGTEFPIELTVARVGPARTTKAARSPHSSATSPNDGRSKSNCGSHRSWKPSDDWLAASRTTSITF